MKRAKLEPSRRWSETQADPSQAGRGQALALALPLGSILSLRCCCRRRGLLLSSKVAQWKAVSSKVGSVCTQVVQAQWSKLAFQALQAQCSKSVSQALKAQFSKAVSEAVKAQLSKLFVESSCVPSCLLGRCWLSSCSPGSCQAVKAQWSKLVSESS